jgi:hypothetical protein
VTPEQVFLALVVRVLSALLVVELVAEYTRRRKDFP